MIRTRNSLNLNDVEQDFGPRSPVLKEFENLEYESPERAIHRVFQKCLMIKTDPRFSEWVYFLTGTLPYNPITVVYSNAMYDVNVFQAEVEAIILPLNQYPYMSTMSADDKENLSKGRYIELVGRFAFLYEHLARKWAISQLYSWGKDNRRLQGSLRVFDVRADEEHEPLDPLNKGKFLLRPGQEDWEDLSNGELKFPQRTLEALKDSLLRSIFALSKIFHPHKRPLTDRKPEPYGIDLVDRGKDYFFVQLTQIIREKMEQVHERLREVYQPILGVQNNIVWNFLAEQEAILELQTTDEAETLKVLERLGFMIEISAQIYNALGKLERENRIEFYQPTLKHLYRQLAKCRGEVDGCIAQTNRKIDWTARIILQEIRPQLCLKFVRDVQKIQVDDFGRRKARRREVRLNPYWKKTPNYFETEDKRTARVLFWISFFQHDRPEAGMYSGVLEAHRDALLPNCVETLRKKSQVQGLENDPHCTSSFLALNPRQLLALRHSNAYFMEALVEEQVGRELYEAQYSALAAFVARLPKSVTQDNFASEFNRFMYHHRQSATYWRQYVVIVLHIAALNTGKDFAPVFGYLDIEQKEYAEHFLSNREGKGLRERLERALTRKGLMGHAQSDTVMEIVDIFRFNNLKSSDLRP